MKFIHILICLVMVNAFANQALSENINYGDFDGETVFFSQITETSTTTAGPVYGTPTGLGDTLSFVPFGFQATASDDIDFQEGRLSFTVIADDGFAIESISILEATSFVLFGDDSMVVSNLFGVANADASLYSSNSSIAMYSDDFLNGNSFDSKMHIELPGVQQATFVLDSQILAAGIGSGTLASLSKDALVIRVNTRPLVVVPEPSSMFILSVVLSSVLYRRKIK